MLRHYCTGSLYQIKQHLWYGIIDQTTHSSRFVMFCFQIEAAFNGSQLASSFGDVVISDLSSVSDSTVLLTLVINFRSIQAEFAIIQAFLSQLTGGSGGQLAPDHRLLRTTFIIGDPSKWRCSLVAYTHRDCCKECIWRLHKSKEGFAYWWVWKVVCIVELLASLSADTSLRCHGIRLSASRTMCHTCTCCFYILPCLQRSLQDEPHTVEFLHAVCGETN